MKRIFSGSQPTGNLHLGNYLGAIKQYIKYQEEGDGFFCVVDLHALTLPQDPEALRKKTMELATLYVAAGLDPNKATLFIQSHVPAHAEGAWLLQCIARMGELNRMVQFKEKGKGEETAGVGLFTYPILQAADILLYDADIVPVGEDQKQHIELTRDLAERFNHRFGEVLKVPVPMIPEQGARIMGLDNPEKKMSKSAESASNYITLLEDPKSIMKKLKRAVTDSENVVRYDREQKPGVSNLLEIHSLLSGESISALEEKYSDAGYGKLKIETAEVIIDHLTPVRERYKKLVETGEIEEILITGAKRAQEVTGGVLERMRSAMGLVSPYRK
ncbi:tryptophan--tRNA ligase [Mechercharimyces sp. CAU 1602]|uniref:tryptophan--tRNA ligase n=1 Tax=Mechercharimyces sp. CAU 1602 TaxID=2973933 RepID=UPI0021629107|nr:tryptophan--tRNA ligase [Mechercharimyces sp. CAU 1602]MCS1350435.1 tryptophan--tRNA ligase [Mechercharimyces sp. CAU 1602]